VPKMEDPSPTPVMAPLPHHDESVCERRRRWRQREAGASPSGWAQSGGFTWLPTSLLGPTVAPAARGDRIWGRPRELVSSRLRESARRPVGRGRHGRRGMMMLRHSRKGARRWASASGGAATRGGLFVDGTSSGGMPVTAATLAVVNIPGGGARSTPTPTRSASAHRGCSDGHDCKA
jgi:hypothetical protein